MHHSLENRTLFKNKGSGESPGGVRFSICGGFTAALSRW